MMTGRIVALVAALTLVAATVPTHAGPPEGREDPSSKPPRSPGETTAPGRPGGGPAKGPAPTVTSTPGTPTTMEQCKHGGWRTFGFKNQGQCVSSVVSHRR
jgi:hypothetical protein